MSILHVLILGIIEGLTEFIPISSTGHLILVGELLGIEGEGSKTFQIAIQLGAIFAVIVSYPRYFLGFLDPKEWLQPKFKTLIIAILPILVFGFLFYSPIKAYLFSSFTVALGLIFGGIVMIIVDYYAKNRPLPTKEIEDISFKQALIIGVMQCAALWPGMSRSGSTIVGGLLTGLRYELAATFSFLIAVPVMIVAVTYDMLKMASELSAADAQAIGLGLLISFVVAIVAIKTFLRILSRVKLSPFGIYRIIIGILILLLF